MHNSSGDQTPAVQQKTRASGPADGFILVNKPKGITSFDVIRNLRRVMKAKKMGHMGTLDPNATGLLPICLGKATRLSQFLLHGDKTYQATIRLGRSTTTYDIDGDTVGETMTPPEMTREELERHLAAFTGTITQIPPVYSAKKVDGKRLFEYAREGVEVEPRPCEVEIRRITILSQERDVLKLEIHSSSGMYVRSLAHDLGKAIGCGAFLEDLIRIRVGALTLDRAYTLDQIAEMCEAMDFSFVLPMPDLLPDFQRLDINASQANRIRNGNHIVVANPALANRQLVRLFIGGGPFVAVGEVEKPLGSMQVLVHPRVVVT